MLHIQAELPSKTGLPPPSSTWMYPPVGPIHITRGPSAVMFTVAAPTTDVDEVDTDTIPASVPTLATKSMLATEASTISADETDPVAILAIVTWAAPIFEVITEPAANSA